MSIFESIVLGLVQGLSEFLPISSSGHLALLEHFFQIQEDKVMLFAVLLHGGTLISIFAAFYKEIFELILELIGVIKDIFTGKGPRIDKNETRRLGFLIITATIPTAIIGLLFNNVLEGLYSNIIAIGAGLIITGTIMFLTERMKPGKGGIKDMKFRSAVFVGIMQSVALCPGISRSGSTIVGSLITGLNRKTAVNFAFLISIPTVLGAFILEMKDVIKVGIEVTQAFPLVLGILLSAVSGYIAIKTMIRVVSNGRLYVFSIYTWVIGLAVIVYSLVSL